MAGNAASKARKTGKKAPAPGSSRAKGADGLNDKQRLFAVEYIVDLNGTAAAKRAGYSERTAKQAAQELLTKPEIVAKVQYLIQDRAERAKIDGDRVISELSNIALADIRKLFDSRGALLPIDAWPDGISAAIASVEVDEIFQGFGENRIHIGYTKKVKLWDKVKSLHTLGLHLKLWVQRMEHTGPGGGPIPVKTEDDLAGLTDDELEALEQIRKAADSRRAGR